MNPQNIDLIMAQLRSREVRRQDDAAAGMVETTLPPADEIEMWRGAKPSVSIKSEYSLDELLNYSDATFLQNAYMAVLQRDADQEGFDSLLPRLRTGLLTKVELLGTLRWSDEGKAKGVHIDGLLVPFLLQRLKRRRIIGPVVAWCHGVSRLGSMLTRIAAYEGAQAREIEVLGTHVNRAVHALQARMHALSSGQVTLLERLVAVEDGVAEVDDLRESLSNLNSQSKEARERIESALADVKASLDHDLARLRNADAAFSNDIAAIKEVFSQQVTRIHEVESKMSELRGFLAGEVERLQGAAAVMSSDTAAVKKDLDQQSNHIREFETQLSQLRGSFNMQREGEAEAVSLRRSLDSLYVSLEERFRGSKELIRTRALPYLEVIRDAKVGDLGKPVLDIGCGNGDWLQLLRDHGLSARGVDSNRMFVELCQGRGLDVMQGDAVEYLRALPDGVLGAVTGMHIAEHLPFEVLVAVLDECKRVLCIGGVLVLETPNPENLLVASHDFYLDPTHRNPLPPEFLSWLVESRGFQRCRIERLTEARETYAPPLLQDDVPGASSINSIISRLHTAPDYAVIGRRL